MKELKEKKPNTFIVGAPKCGTTAMAVYLSEHPDIFVSPKKEPHYFIREDFTPWHQPWTRMDHKDYVRLFKQANHQSILLEASVWYLYGKNSIKLIREFNPNAQIIVMLRRPDEMLPSMHSQSIISRNESVGNFAQAWGLTHQRKQGRAIPKHCIEVKKLFYDEIAKFGEQLERVYKYFSKEQVHVIFFEDFKTDTRSVYEQTLQFLGVDIIPKNDFEQINENKKFKSKILGNFTKRPPKWIMAPYRNFKTLTRFKGLGILDMLNKLNSQPTRRDPLSKELKKDIQKTYEKDIQKLETLTGRDLSHWLDAL